MYDDSPDWRLLNALFCCLYADHPLRDNIAGTVESIAGLTPQMLYNCTKGFYAPSNMVLSVAGKITLEQAVEACKRNGLYRARAAHEVEWDIPADNGPLAHKEAHFTMPVTKPCFGVAYKEEPLVPGDLKRELLLDMLSDLVVGGLTKLYRKLYDNAMVNPEFSGDFYRGARCLCRGLYRRERHPAGGRGPVAGRDRAPAYRGHRTRGLYTGEKPGVRRPAG